jgi:hypothetical protein
MEKWCAEHKGENFIRPVYIIFRDSDKVLVWDGENATPYEKNFNRADYIEDTEAETKPILKFAFCDNGREVCSKTWEADVYPRFVRTNIDISNSKNKYKAEGVFMPVERAIIDEFNNTHTDLIPVIVRELCSVCSFDKPENYNSMVEYGDTTYDLSIRRANARYYRAIEKKLAKKTSDYFYHR